jgi:hypothetical protein
MSINRKIWLRKSRYNEEPDRKSMHRKSRYNEEPDRKSRHREEQVQRKKAQEVRINRGIGSHLRKDCVRAGKEWIDTINCERYDDA